MNVGMALTLVILMQIVPILWVALAAIVFLGMMEKVKLVKVRKYNPVICNSSLNRLINRCTAYSSFNL